MAVLILHAVGGRMLGHEPYVDPIMHFLGGTAAALFLRHAASVAGRQLGVLTKLGLDLLAFGLTCATALFWEFGEFASDLLLGTRTQRSLGNTMRDLALGVGGAVAYLAIKRAMGRIEKRRVVG